LRRKKYDYIHLDKEDKETIEQFNKITEIFFSKTKNNEKQIANGNNDAFNVISIKSNADSLLENEKCKIKKDNLKLKKNTIIIFINIKETINTNTRVTEKEHKKKVVNRYLT